MSMPTEIDEKGRTVRFAPGEYLFRQNDQTQDLFIVKSGLVRIFKNEGSVEIDLDIIGIGNVVGEVASIDGGVRTASGVAIETCDAVVIPASEFQSILAAIPEWFKKIALILVQRLREVDSRISRSVDGERTNHVAALISLLSFSNSCIACSDGFVLDKKFIEYEAVDLLGMQLSEVTASLERLQKQQFLKLDRARIILARRDALDELAQKVFQANEELPVT